MEVISREIIKPSLPTPFHLQNYQLSFLDQINPSIYTSFIVFYASNSNNINFSNNEKSDGLKASLSDTLTHFYPLAGRLAINNESVNCNDEGVPFIEVQARSNLLEVILNPDIREFDKFVPREFLALDKLYENVLLAIQVSYFDCGGLAIGICISHKIADATSRLMFLKTWAETLRGQGKTILDSPLFESAKHFPPKDLSSIMPLLINKPFVVKEEKKKMIVTKMFVFDSSKLEILRKKFSGEINQECPLRATRIEALTAFLAYRYAFISKVNTKTSTSFQISHMINIRSRMDPPLSKYHFGNYYAFARAKRSIEEVQRGCSGGLVAKIREAIKGIDGKFVADNIRDSNMYIDNIIKERSKVDIVSMKFSSSCRMGAYEVDFGWGRPVKMGLVSSMLKNWVRFQDTRDEDGIEAWINLEEEDMAKLEGDQEFLSFISPAKTCI